MKTLVWVFAIALMAAASVEGGVTLEGHRVLSYGFKKSSFGPTTTSASGPGVLVTPETDVSSLASSFPVVPLLPDSFDLSLATDVLAADPAGVIFLLPPPSTPLDPSFIMVRLSSFPSSHPPPLIPLLSSPPPLPPPPPTHPY